MKMFVKRNVAVLSMVAMLFGTLFVSSNTAYAASGDTVVYITKTGECYHTSKCSSLKKSKIQTTMQEAVNKGLRPCSKCKPGSIDGASTTTASTTDKSTVTTVVNNTTVVNVATDAVEALKTYKGNTKEFNAYTYYTNNADLQTAIGADGDKLLKHYKEYGKAEGRKAK